MGIVISVFEALVVAYAVAIGLQLVLGFLVTRLGRGILLSDGSRVNSTYLGLLAVAWVVSSTSGSFMAVRFCPFEGAGPIIFALLSGLMLIWVVTRNRKDSPHRQSITSHILFSASILVGSALGYLLYSRGHA
jgi:hypothetical protein